MTRKLAFKTDLDLKIIKGLSLAKVPVDYDLHGKLVFAANPKLDKESKAVGANSIGVAI